jgi:hypothetical protein
MEFSYAKYETEVAVMNIDETYVHYGTNGVTGLALKI